MKSAKTHLEEVDAFKATRNPGTPYVGVGLTKEGYEVLGIATLPADTSFRRGMKDPVSRRTLADPPSSLWEVPYRQVIHAVVLIGDSHDTPVNARHNEILALLPDTATVLGEETGLTQLNEQGDGIEHFGYIDGRSQPLFLVEDIDAERDSTDGTNAWDPSAPLDRVLVADAAAPDPNVHFGSYFIFRKLEQNVRRFRQAEEDLADTLGLQRGDRDRAGAMLVGRFRDGTPLTLQRGDGSHHLIMNNFTYDSDGQSAKCRFHAHIRKTNPRGVGGAEPPQDERRHLMARRGQTYGERADVPFDNSVPPHNRPREGVGLLFMAFNANINIEDNPPLAQFDLGAALLEGPCGVPLTDSPSFDFGRISTRSRSWGRRHPALRPWSTGCGWGGVRSCDTTACAVAGAAARNGTPAEQDVEARTVCGASATPTSWKLTHPGGRSMIRR